MLKARQFWILIFCTGRQNFFWETQSCLFNKYSSGERCWCAVVYFILTTHPCTWPRAQNHTWENNNKSASVGFHGAPLSCSWHKRENILIYKTPRALHSSPTFCYICIMMISAFLKTAKKHLQRDLWSVCVIWLLINEGALITRPVFYIHHAGTWFIQYIWCSRVPKIVSQMCALCVSLSGRQILRNHKFASAGECIIGQFV
jgi:hypothetical protein